MSAMRNVVIRGRVGARGRLVTEQMLMTRTSVGPKGFVEKAGDGAYTTGRTMKGRTALFQGSFHAVRLADSMNALGSCGWDAGEVEEMVVALCREGAIAYEECVADDASQGALGEDDELKVVICVPLEEDVVAAHFSPMVGVPPPPVLVEFRPMEGVKKHSTTAKATSWVRDRKVFEAAKSGAANEVVPYDPDGSAVEGLSSNFYVVDAQGALVTAPDSDVLKGSVRATMLEVAGELGMEIRMEAPSIHDVESWMGVFVSSTSRKALPAHQIDVFDTLDASSPSTSRSLCNDQGELPSVVVALRDGVAAAMEHDSLSFINT